MPRPKIKDLHGDCITTQPRAYHWEPARYDCAGDEGWRYWEAEECDGCGTYLVLSAFDGRVAHSILDRTSTCDGYVRQSEGPMMSYYYPIRLDDPVQAARTIARLPLCVVSVDGETGLALTGGGMDLSWEICEAFMLLGELPPIHFDLPAMADRGVAPRDRWIIAGARKSIQVMRRRLKWRTFDLNRLVRDARAREDARR